MYTIGHRGVSLQCASQTRRVEKGRVPCLDGDAGICLPNSDGGKGAGPPCLDGDAGVRVSFREGCSAQG
jgi:hypothetical protein